MMVCGCDCIVVMMVCGCDSIVTVACGNVCSPAGVPQLRHPVGGGHLHGAPAPEKDQVGGRPAQV